MGSGRVPVPGLRLYGDSGLPWAGQGRPTNSRWTSPLTLPPHLPLETPVNLFLAHQGREERPSGSNHFGGQQPAWQRPPTPPPFVGLPLPQAQAWPHPTTWPPSSAQNRQTLRLEAQEAGRADESLFLQSKEAGRLGPSDPPNPHGVPGQLLPKL